MRNRRYLVSRGNFDHNHFPSSTTETDENDNETEGEAFEQSPGEESYLTSQIKKRGGVTTVRQPSIHRIANSSSGFLYRNLEPSSQTETDRGTRRKLGTFKTRTLWTIILIISFLLILAAGHFYTGILVLVLTILVYHEVIALKRNIEKDKKLPLFFFLRWYWFVLTVYGTGYQWILPLADALQLPRYFWLQIMVSHHLIITYVSAFFGLMLFILSLRRFTLRYQFSQFALLLLTCLFVVGQGMFQIANIYEGLVWFFVSSSSVIVNDVSAYIFGIFFGKTQLIKLSPKKTVEGFLGASAITLIWAMLVSHILLKYRIFICPQTELTFRPFATWYTLTCDPHPAFKLKAYRLPQTVATFLGHKIIYIRTAWIHCFVLGFFAAFFAPFGGFFASALKRALRVKDFGASIPGHGGITDRFDCQLIMGMFTYLYVRTFVFRNVRRPSVEVIARFIQNLSPKERSVLLRLIQDMTEIEQLAPI